MTEEKQTFDTVIIGSGPAGLTAAIYNVRANLKTIVLAGEQPGGQLTITTIVENYPGFPHGIGGTKLMMDTLAQVKNLGVEVRNGIVNKVQKPKTKDQNFGVVLESGDILETKAVIIATGARAKWLNIGEKELIGRGVSGCATCDGAFFRDKVVAVVGGGDVACGDADFLTRFATKVYLIHRRDELRAQVALNEKVKGNPKIEFVWNSEVRQVTGNQKLEKITIFNNKTNTESELVADGLFVAIGHDPAVEFVRDLVDIKDNGRIKTMIDKEYMTMTSVPGVFAAGDCVDDVYRQAIVAAGDGAKAGLDAERWLGSKSP